MSEAARVTLWHTLTFRDAKSMISWLEAIGFTPHAAYWDESGDKLQHAEMLWGTGGIMFGSYTEGRQEWPKKPGTAACYLITDDPDGVYARAIAAGGTSVTEPQDQDYGGRNATVVDPEGNLWSIGSYQPS